MRLLALGGSYLLTGLALLGDGCSGRAVNVTGMQAVDCILLSVTVSPPSVTMHPGDTLRAAAHPPPPCGSMVTYTFRWLSSDTTVASVDSVSGLVLARHQGTTTIVVDVADNRSVQGAMAVQVVP
jgi:hypothetical protein